MGTKYKRKPGSIERLPKWWTDEKHRGSLLRRALHPSNPPDVLLTVGHYGHEGEDPALKPIPNFICDTCGIRYDLTVLVRGTPSSTIHRSKVALPNMQLCMECATAHFSWDDVRELHEHYGIPGKAV